MNPRVEPTDEVLEAQAVLADPATSYWLKSAIEAAMARDPVDALNDALVLAAVLDDRLREALQLDDSL
jgi:TPP-dependent pyruvate/acetoin dehydrogenase alpha subunit